MTEEEIDKQFSIIWDVFLEGYRLAIGDFPTNSTDERICKVLFRAGFEAGRNHPTMGIRRVSTVPYDSH